LATTTTSALPSSESKSDSLSPAADLETWRHSKWGKQNPQPIAPRFSALKVKHQLKNAPPAPAKDLRSNAAQRKIFGNILSPKIKTISHLNHSITKFS